MPTKGKPSTARSSTMPTKMMTARLYQWSSRAHQLVCISRITWCLLCLLSSIFLSKKNEEFSQKLSHDISGAACPRLKKRAAKEADTESSGLCCAAIWRKRAAKCPTTVAKIGLRDVSCGQKICRIWPGRLDLTWTSLLLARLDSLDRIMYE